MANPTNKDIVNLITTQHEEVRDRLKDVEMQVKYTNGQVRALKEWQAGVIAVEEEREKGAQVSSNPKDTDWSKWTPLFIALAAALIAIGTAIGKP